MYTHLHELMLDQVRARRWAEADGSVAHLRAEIAAHVARCIVAEAVIRTPGAAGWGWTMDGAS